jgi:hypothetical protein
VANEAFVATVTGALWPLVMVSATAPLIISISAALSSLSARARQLAAELRDTTTPAPRRESIRDQLRWFQIRALLAYGANLLLYVSVLCFVGTVAVMSITGHSVAAVAWIFLVGTALLLAAVALQVAELAFAQRTLDRDLRS